MSDGRSAHRHLVIIGGQRCGTTWLGEVLAAHPGVRFTTVTRPEPKFFLDDDDHDRYDALFPHAGGSWYVDKSTTYLERDDAARRAASCVPDAIAVAVLRDPVERAYSNWRFSVMNGLEDLSFGQSLTNRAQRRVLPGLSTSPFGSLRRGRYAELLEPWADRFDTRLLVLQYERLTAIDGGRYLRDRLAAVGFEPVEGWPIAPPPVNEAPMEAPMDDVARSQLIEYYDGPNRALAVYGIDTTLWSV